MRCRHVPRPFAALLLSLAALAAAAAAPARAGASPDLRQGAYGTFHPPGLNGRALSTGAVVRLLHRHGYQHVASLRYLSGRGLYAAEGHARRGGAFQVFVDPHSGRILAHDPPRARPHRLDRHDVVRRLLWAGYSNISRPEYRRGGYLVRADDRFGYRRLLQVDPHTGVIRRLRASRRPWW